MPQHNDDEKKKMAMMKTIKPINRPSMEERKAKLSGGDEEKRRPVRKMEKVTPKPAPKPRYKKPMARLAKVNRKGATMEYMSKYTDKTFDTLSERESYDRDYRQNVKPYEADRSYGGKQYKATQSEAEGIMAKKKAFNKAKETYGSGKQFKYNPKTKEYEPIG